MDYDLEIVILLALAFQLFLLFIYEPALGSWWEAIFEFDFASSLTLFSPFRFFGVANRETNHSGFSLI